MDLLRSRIKYYVPILKWLPKYDYKKDLTDDILAGITVAFLLIPQGLSYASGLAKLEPVYGLYSCFFSIIVYGIMGTSKQLSIGPEALVSLLVGNAISQTASATSTMEDHVGLAASLAMMVGLITLALGLARLGFLDSILSRALLRGFITAVACVIVIEQLPALLGIQLPENPATEDDEHFESPFGKFIDILDNIYMTNGTTLVISLVSIVFLLGFGRVKRYIAVKISQNYLDDSHRTTLFNTREWQALSPPPLDSNELLSNTYESFPHSWELHGSDSSINSNAFSRLPFHIRIFFFIPEILIVVMCSIFITYTCNLNSANNVAILGEAAMNGGFRMPRLPVLTRVRFKNLLTSATLISILGFVESIIATKKYARKYRYPVSANRELVAYGCINVVGSFLNCFPTFSSIARTQVHDAAGAKTQLSGLVTGLFILITILFILPIFYYLPKAVMASIVLVAAVGLLEFEDALFIWKIRAWKDLALMAFTFFITIFWSVESGTLISIAVSLVLVIKHSSMPKIDILGKVVENGRTEDGVPKIKFRPINEIFRNPEEYKMTKEDMEMLIVKVEESLFFANTGQLQDRLRRAEAYCGWMHIHPSEEERRPFTKMRRGKQNLLNDLSLDEAELSDSEEARTNPETITDIESGENEPIELKAVIFDIENMISIDASAIQVLIDITKEYRARDIDVCFVKLRENNKQIFIRSGLLGEVIGSDQFFRKISDAITALKQNWSRNQLNNRRPEDETTSFSAYSVL